MLKATERRILRTIFWALVILNIGWWGYILTIPPVVTAPPLAFSSGRGQEPGPTR